MEQEKRKLEIGEAGFLLYFAYAAYIWLCEATDLFCFLLEIRQVTFLSRALILVFLAAAGFWARKRVSFRESGRIDFLFVLGSIIILAFCGYKGIIPDVSLDVTSYHLLAQKPGFASMTQGPSFMPGNFQCYGFRWADRMFYLFRQCLGYRMGTLFGGLIRVLIYWQIRSLIQTLYGEKLRTVRMRFKSIFRQPLLPGIMFFESTLAFFATQIHDVWLQSGSYMVELIGIPFALEAMHILLTKDSQKHLNEMVWYALLCGCFFAMKMTHVVYIAPMILLYLIKHRDVLSIKRFFTAFVVAIIPVSVYLIYAYADTGNPVFPYYNTTFKSPYFAFSDFKDVRWGPQNLLELLAWPFLSVVNPNYRTSEIPNEHYAGMICLMVVLLVQGIRFIRAPKRENHGELLFVIFVSAYLWSATTGHIRYFMLGQILIGVLFCGYVADQLYYKNRLGTAVSLIALIILMQMPAKHMESVYSGKEWSWRNLRDKGFVSYNAELLLNDQKTKIDENFQDDIKAILINAETNGSLASLLCPDKPIIYYSYLKGISDLNIQKYWESRIDGYLETGGVYEVLMPAVDGINWGSYIEMLNGYGLKMKSIVWPQTVFVRDHAVAFVELEKLEAGKNQVYIANQDNDQFSVPNKRIRFSASLMLSQGRGWREEEDSTVCIVADDGEKSTEVYRGKIKEKTTIHVDEELDLTVFGEDVKLKLYWYDDRSGERVDTWTYQCMMICPEIAVIE